MDFVAIVSQPVIFTSGDTSKQLTVRILDDNIVEADEVLSLSLTTGAGSPLAVGTPGTALITINDDDGMYRCIYFNCVLIYLDHASIPHIYSVSVYRRIINFGMLSHAWNI